MIPEEITRRLHHALRASCERGRYLITVDANERSISYKIAEYLQSEFVDWNVQKPAVAETAELELECNKCHRRFKVQANLGRAQPINPGAFPFPADNKLKCPSCSAEHDLSDARRQLQAQTKKPVG